MKSKLLLLLLILGCASCVSSRDVSRWLIWEKPIEVAEVRRSQQCGSTDVQTRVLFFGALEQVKAWEAERGLTLTTAPGPALGSGAYALIELGQKATGGYGLAVSRLAAHRKSFLILKTTFIVPASDAMTAQALTSPCVLVRLPERRYDGLEVVDQTGKLRAAVDVQP